MTEQIGCGLSRKADKDNNMTNHIGVISIEYDTEFSKPTRQITIYDEDNDVIDHTSVISLEYGT